MQLKPGFSLLEIAVVMLILGVVLSFGMPKVFKSYNTPLDKFVAQANKIMQTAVQASIKSNNIQKLVINNNTKEINLFNTQNNNLISRVSLPSEIDINAVYVNGKNLLGTDPNNPKTASFFVNPEGIAQRVTVLFTYSENPQNTIYKLKLNPFSGKFRLA